MDSSGPQLSNYAILDIFLKFRNVGKIEFEVRKVKISKIRFFDFEPEYLGFRASFGGPQPAKWIVQDPSYLIMQ